MINQHLIALKLERVSINKSIAPEFVTVKVNVKYANTVKSATY